MNLQLKIVLQQIFRKTLFQKTSSCPFRCLPLLGKVIPGAKPRMFLLEQESYLSYINMVTKKTLRTPDPYTTIPKN